MQEERKDEESHLDCNNSPEEPCSESWKYVEVEAREMSAASASSEDPSTDQLDSDFIPSVSLAAFLALVFFVSLILLHHRNSCLPLGDYRAVSPSKACPTKSSLWTLCRLFPNQPETTWQTLQQYMHGQPGGTHPGKLRILVAVGLGDASGTLLCLTKATLSFLTEVHAVRVRYLEQRSTCLSWRDILENRTCDISTAEIYVGQSLVPYGIMVSTKLSLDGKWLAAKINLAMLLNGTEQAREMFLLQDLTLPFMSDIVNAILLADKIPDKLMTTNGSLFVLLVRSEQYLEGGFVC